MKADRRPVLCILAIAVAASATACSGSASTTTASAPTVPATKASAAAAATTSAAAATTSANGCPSASAVSAAAGVQLSAPQVTNQSSTLLCSYPSSSGILAISRAADAGYSADTVLSALQNQAQALGLSSDSVQPVSGVGDAAYEFTQSGSTTLGIVSGNAYIAIIGAPSAAAAETVAKLYLG